MGWINSTTSMVGNVSTFWWWTGVILFTLLVIDLMWIYYKNSRRR